MKENSDIHYLVQELIPVINDISPEAQEIVKNHAQSCASCRKLYESFNELEMAFPERPKSDEEVEVKPLKKLVQFNLGIRILLIAVRVVILAYITYSGLSFGREFPGSTLTFMQGSLYIFYLPAAVFLLIFTFVFLPKKWLYSTLAADVLVIFAMEIVWKFIIF